MDAPSIRRFLTIYLLHRVRATGARGNVFSPTSKRSKRPAMMRALLKRYRQKDERQARGSGLQLRRTSTSARGLVEKIDSARGEHAE
jgi:hypothetical protein